MRPAEIVGKAVYVIEGDQTGEEQQSMVIAHDNALWLVATWLQSNDTGRRYPERIVPMATLPHRVQLDGLFRLAQSIPRELVSPDASPEVLQRYGAVTHP